jgi:hypothetical protein
MQRLYIVKYIRKDNLMKALLENIQAWLERFSEIYLAFCEMVNRRNME